MRLATYLLCLLTLAAAMGNVDGAHPEQDAIQSYIGGNVWPVTGLPRSYFVPSQSYWQGVYSNAAVEKLGYAGALADPGRLQERFILQYGLNLYDGACFQIASCLGGNQRSVHYANYHTRRLLTNKTWGWSQGSRGYTKFDQGQMVYEYGDQRRSLADTNAFYFRVASELYSELDPLLNSLGSNVYTVWQDWKPVTGENAWCGYIGPLQAAYLSFGGHIPRTDPSIKLAYEMLPAVEAMQCAIGALYHVPTGVSGKYPNEISNENNFSMYAGLKMFRQVLQNAQADGGNLLRNGGFEDAGALGPEDPSNWRWGSPDYHADVWGNIGRQQWAVHGGSYLGAIRGTWAGVNYGGFWQEAPTQAGLTNTVTGWFKQDADWTSANQEWKVEFYNGDYYQLGAVTQALTGVGTAWGQKSLTAVAPAGAIWARLVIAADGAGSNGALQFDDLVMTAAPFGVNITGGLARLNTVITNMENYFRNYLYNTNDEVFFTGGTYATNTATFTPYVFDPYWIGGPYRGSNAFTSTTFSPPQPEWLVNFTATNEYNGYDSVKVHLRTDKDATAVDIFKGTGYAMTQVNPRYFTHTFTGLNPGTNLTYYFNIVAGLVCQSSNLTWNVQRTEPAMAWTNNGTKQLFAVDCQTWGMAVLGADQVDAWFGEGTAYDIWQRTKRLAGYFYPGDTTTVRGVGFSDINNRSNDIVTAEWTFGAILMCRNLARDYWALGRPELAQDLSRDADSMREAIEALKVTVTNISTETTSAGSGSVFTFDEQWANWGSPSQQRVTNGVAYLYANKRYEIPFGWWANALPSLASTTWAIMTDHNFDPFVLGGADTNRASSLIPWVAVHRGVHVEAHNMTVGRTFRLQRSADLIQWQDRFTNVVTFLPGTTWSNQPADGQAQWFYRLYSDP